jgi:hypothetical protein
MKIKLTYTVDLEDSLMEAGAMIDDQSPILGSCVLEFNKIIDMFNNKDQFDISDFCEKITTLHQKLAKVNLRLHDLTEILKDLQKHEPEKAAAEIPPQETEVSNAIKINGYSQSHGFRLPNSDKVASAGWTAYPAEPE